MKIAIISFIFLINISAYSGEYLRRGNSEIAKSTDLAIIGTVTKVLDKSTNTEFHQIITVEIDGVLKGEYEDKEITYVARRGLKANFYNKISKGENGVFLFVLRDKKYYLADPILGFVKFSIKNPKK
jgi:hypothetical protein